MNTAGMDYISIIYGTGPDKPPLVTDATVTNSGALILMDMGIAMGIN